MGVNLAITEEVFGNEDRSWAKDRLGFKHNRPITLDLSLFDASYYAADGAIPSGTPLALSGSVYGPHDPPTNEVQTITINGGPTGGTFTMKVGSSGTPSATLSNSPTLATVQARLDALYGEGNVLATGSTGGPFTVTATDDGADAGINIVGLQLGTNSLSGGTSPTVAFATTTQGGTDDDSGQTLAGLLFTSVRVPTGQEDAKVGAALFWMGVVDRTKLPFLIPSTSEADVPGIRFEGGL